MQWLLNLPIALWRRLLLIGQGLGALLMLLSVASFAFLPWLDRSPVRSIRYKGRWSRVALALFALAFVSLGVIGLKPATPAYVLLARVFTAIYLGYFWLMPVYSKWERARPVPDRVRYQGG